MKKITKRIAAIIASAAMISSFGITVSAKTFPDVPTTHWAYATINSVTDEGIFKGMTDGTFHPDDIITHEEFTTAIINYVCAKLGQGTVPVSQDYEQYITDDKTDNRYWNNRWVSWAQPSLNKAVELGIIGTSGTYTDELKEYYEEATFYDDVYQDINVGNFLAYGDPMQDLARDIAINTPITREEAARLTTRALLITEPDLKPVLAEKNPIYYQRIVYPNICTLVPDWFSIAPEYRQDVVAEYFAGIMQGDESYFFNPQNNLTRAEAATIMKNLANKDERRNTDNLSFEMWDIMEQAGTDAEEIISCENSGDGNPNTPNDLKIEIPDRLMQFMMEERVKSWKDKERMYRRMCNTINYIETYISTGDCPDSGIVRGNPDYYIHYLPMLKDIKDKIDAGLL